jgi:hypothetical protein
MGCAYMMSGQMKTKWGWRALVEKHLHAVVRLLPASSRTAST